jgi:amino acid adenylation domain-containing protein
MSTTEIPRRVTNVLDVIAAQVVAADPSVCAVTCNGVDVSWRELDAWAWSAAEELASRGMGVGDYVPVIAARGGALVAGWLGALRAGAAYVPLSLDTPSHRLEYILREMGARTVLVDQAGAALAGDLGIGAGLVDIEGLRAVENPRRVSEGPGPLTGSEPAVVIYTSGTTGRPKGVLVPHRGLLNTVLWWADDADLQPEDRLLCTWSTSFDGATFDTFRSLVAGAQLVFVDDVERRDPRALLRLVRGPKGATVTAMTPSLLRAMLNADEGGPTTLRTLYVGGEALPSQLAEECTRRWGVPMRNVYGPTEASCISTCAAVDLAGGQPPAIGLPIPNTRAYVLGPNQEELPVGVPGELYVAGDGVALGYLGQPERTAAAFVPDPYAVEPGVRMYRTGDRVVLRADGLLECMGRVDDQVKILGNRIEPNEVRKLLEEQPAVLAAAVHADGEPPRLVAYVQLAGLDASTAGSPDDLPTRDALVRPLLRWLPPAVVPAEVYVVDALPISANDKVDFAALRDIRSLPLSDASPQQVQLTDDERRAGQLFAAALAEGERGVPPVAQLGPDTDFFMVGGHSLLAVKMLAEAEQRWGEAVPLRHFLSDPTIAGLGRLLGAAAATPLEATTIEGVQTQGAPPGRYPVTSAQQRFWFMDRVSTLRSAYVAPVVVELTGPVDRSALERSVELVLARHPALRSRFELDRQRRQVLYRTDGSSPAVVLTDAEALGWGPHDIAAHVSTLCWAPFDLASDAPARGEIISAGDRTLLVLSTHHIVTDGWSQQVLLEQISEAYHAGIEGRPPELPDPVHPAEVAGSDFGSPLDWRINEVVSRLHGAPTDVQLPHDRLRPEVQPTDGVTCTTTLSAELTARLRAVADELGCTTFMVTAAVFAVALAQSSEQRDFVFAFPWAGREAPGSANAVGMFVNTLVLRVDLRDEPAWRDLLSRVRDESIACYRNADVPFDAVAARLHPDRDLSRPPLTPVYMSALEGTPQPPCLGPTVVSRYLPPEPLRVKYELELTATDSAEGLALTAAYAVDLFDATTITKLLAAIVDSAAELVANPDASVLSPQVPDDIYPAANGVLPAGEAVAAEDDLLERVRQAWSDVLGTDAVPVGVNFFEAGGDSLLLIVLMDHLNGMTERELEAADLFQHSTVRAQAELLAAPAGSRELCVLGARDRHRLLGRARRDQPIAALSTGSTGDQVVPDLKESTS